MLFSCRQSFPTQTIHTSSPILLQTPQKELICSISKVSKSGGQAEYTHTIGRDGLNYRFMRIYLPAPQRHLEVQD